MSEIDFGLLGPQRDFTGDYVNAFQVGQNLAKQQATRSALSTYATNPQGAVNALLPVDPEKAIQLQGFAQQQADRTARIGAATSYAGGDMQGAKTALAGTGDLTGEVSIDQHVAALTTAQRDQAAKVAQIIGNVAAGALHYPQEQRASILQHLKPSLVAQGVPEAQIDNVDLSDAGLQAISQSSLTFAERLQQANAEETHRHNVVEESKAQPIAMSADQQIVNANPLTPGGDAPAAPAAGGGGAAPAPTGPVYDQIAAAAQQNGATPQESTYVKRLGQFESHGDPNAQNGASTGVMQFHPDTFQRVLPGGNINSVADQTKAALTMSRQDRQALQGAGVTPDDGNTYILHQQGPAGGKALLTAPPNLNAVSVLTPIYGDAATAKKAIVNNGGTPDMTAGQFVQMTHDKFMGAAPTAAGSAPPAAPAAGGGRVLATGTNFGAAQALTAAAQSGKTGQDLLSSLPPAQQAQVKALAEGRLPFPSGMALKTPYWQNLIGVVAQYDPSFNAQDYNARNRTRLDFTSGASAKSMTALSTAINHGEEVLKTGAALGNVQIPLVGNAFNALKNTASAASGDPAVGNFKSAAQTYLTEVAKVLQGGPPHEGELNRAQQVLNDANSPAQIQGAVKTISQLLMGRFGPLIDQYNQGMGTVNTTPPSIKPSVWAAFQRQLGGQSVPSGGNSGGFKVLSVTP